MKANVAPEYGPAVYLDYDNLDEIIRVLSSLAPSGYVACLTVYTAINCSNLLAE